MNTYKVTISYIGTGYEGWQIQPKPARTIQRTLNEVLIKIAKNDDISSLASGRTDSGVHALNQVVKVTLPFFIEEYSLLKALNSHLPKEIRVLECVICDANFHPVKDAVSKLYRYVIFEGSELPPFLKDRALLVKPGVNWQQVQSCLDYFVGTKDFINFSTKGTPVATTIREIMEASLVIDEVKNIAGIDLIHSQIRELRFRGNGFLKQMVRLLVGSCLNVGMGKREVDELPSFFSGLREDKFAPVVAPDGLYLDSVEYLTR